MRKISASSAAFITVLFFFAVVCLPSHTSASDSGGSNITIDATDYLMVGKNPGHTSWDGLNYSIYSFLNSVEESISAGLSIPAIQNGSIYISDEEGSMYRINAANISELLGQFWTESTLNSPVPLADGVLAATTGGTIYKLNLSMEITTYFSMPDGILSPPLTAGDFVYVAYESGLILQLDLETFSIISQFDAGSSIEQGMASDGTYLYASTGEGTIIQLLLSNISNEISLYESGSQITSPLMTYENYLYIGSGDGKIYQLDSANISNYISEINTGLPVYSSPSAENGFLYAAGRDGVIYLANASNISQLIETKSLGSQVYASPAIYGDSAYILTTNGEIYRLNSSNLDILSYYDSGENAEESIAITANYIFAGTSQGTLLQLNSLNFSAENTDIFPPRIDYFGSSDSEQLFRKDIRIDIILTDDNFPVNGNVFLYDENLSMIAEENFSTSDNFSAYFYGLANGNYTYNASVCDIFENCASNEMKSVTIYVPGDNLSDWRMHRNNPSRTGASSSEFDIIYGLHQRNISLNSQVWSSPSIKDGKLCISGMDGTVHILSASNISSELMQINVPSPVFSSAAMTGNFLYFASVDGTVYQADAESGAIIAEFASGAPIYSSPAVSGGYLYIGTDDGTLYQLSAWNISNKITEFRAGDSITSSPAVFKGFVYVGSNDGSIYQLNSSNINIVVASFETGGWVTASPAVHNDSLFIGSNDGYLYHLNASNISLLIGELYIESNIDSSCAVDDENIFFGANDGYLYQVDAHNISTIKNKYYTGSDVASSPVIAGNFVYAGNNNGNLYQIYISNASRMAANFTTLYNSPLYSSPAAAGDYIYIAAFDGTVYQLSKENISRPDMDMTSPFLEFSEPTSADSTITAEYIQVNASAFDEEPGISFVSINLYNENYSLINFVNSTFSPVFANFSYLDDGQYYFDAVACDLDGNCNSTETRTVFIDSTPPLLSINYSLIGANISGSDIVLKISVFDLMLMNLSVFLYDSSGNLVNFSNTTENMEPFNFSNLPDDTYSIMINACDAEGRCNSSNLTSITLDTAEPVIIIVPPAQNGSETINISAEDSAFEYLNITIYDEDNIPVKMQFVPTSEAMLNFTNLPDGDYYVEAYACDFSGNCQKRTLLIRIKMGLIYISEKLSNNAGTSRKGYDRCTSNNCSQLFSEDEAQTLFQDLNFTTEETAIQNIETPSLLIAPQNVSIDLLNVEIVDDDILRIVFDAQAPYSEEVTMQFIVFPADSDIPVIIDEIKLSLNSSRHLIHNIDTSTLAHGDYILLVNVTGKNTKTALYSTAEFNSGHEHSLNSIHDALNLSLKASVLTNIIMGISGQHIAILQTALNFLLRNMVGPPGLEPGILSV